MMTNFNFISFLIFLSGLFFVHQIYRIFQERHALGSQILTKIGTIHIIFIFSLYFFFFRKPFWFWISVFLSLLLIPAFLFLIKKIHQQQFLSEFLRFVSMVLLKMQMGNCFQTAIEYCLGSETWKHRPLLVAIHGNVVFSQQTFLKNTGSFPAFLNKIIQEFQFIQDNQHQAVDRLCNFRDNLREELFFRRKSRQIWYYFGYQWLLLTGIYFIILFFIINQYGFLPFINVFLLSFGLYFLGGLTLYLLGRNKKWDI